MENDNEKYLKKLQKQNRVLLIILIVIIAVGILIGISLFNIQHRRCNRKKFLGGPREVEYFNSQFIIYGGNQSVGKLKSLLDAIIKNSMTYQEEPHKLPGVDIDRYSENSSISENKTDGHPDYNKSKQEYQIYVDTLKDIQNNLKKEYNNHSFMVEFDYDSEGAITYIHIRY